MNTATTEITIAKLTSVFATYDLPEVIVSDDDTVKRKWLHLSYDFTNDYGGDTSTASVGLSPENIRGWLKPNVAAKVGRLKRNRRDGAIAESGHFPSGIRFSLGTTTETANRFLEPSLKQRALFWLKWN